MAHERIIPIQFQTPLVDQIEIYVKEGLYASKAEFVREAVRRMINEMRVQMFRATMQGMKDKVRARGVKITSPFTSKQRKEELFEELKKELIQEKNAKAHPVSKS
jgi:Arc/MetJ-type ribon-helix-helix transcriptional regulator